uniref:Uncharacterized protein n=1 Tax=Lepeophtheirus salmonis TaxID=72036 RepID=A0A0K2UIT7_LEPSM
MIQDMSEEELVGCGATNHLEKICII